MTAELERALKRHTQWVGTYRKSGELKLIQVWLTVNDGVIEFLTGGDSYKVKRLKRDPRAVCNIGGKNGPEIKGTAEIVSDKEAAWRVYRAYWKTHPIIMLVLGRSISRHIKSGSQVLIRIQPDDPDLLRGVTDPVI
jgi:PPOX class probable F420-dependent enzyme